MEVDYIHHCTKSQMLHHSLCLMLCVFYLNIRGYIGYAKSVQSQVIVLSQVKEQVSVCQAE